MKAATIRLLGNKKKIKNIYKKKEVNTHKKAIISSYLYNKEILIDNRYMKAATIRLLGNKKKIKNIYKKKEVNTHKKAIK